jgi:molybdopterin synthase catalytic subunit
MITVKLFAILKDKAGREELLINAGHATVSELLTQIATEYPVLKDLLYAGGVIVSVNHEFVKQSSHVHDGDEVAIMPPFSGGDESHGNIRIQKELFSLDREIERLKQSSSSIGAIVTFVGTTRDISQGKPVAKLEFEHYPGMADKKLEEIRQQAVRDFGVIEVTIIHRIGTLPVSENIVMIAVAAEHRDEAFRACRFCIDELKRITPIWKKETTPDGEVWVEGHP